MGCFGRPSWQELALSNLRFVTRTLAIPQAEPWTCQDCILAGQRSKPKLEDHKNPHIAANAHQESKECGVCNTPRPENRPQVSITLHIFQKGFCIDAHDSGFQRYSRWHAPFLRALEEGYIPPYLR